MSKIKILTIIGARPQFIKAAVLSRAFKKFPEQIEEKILHTGQHFDANMSDVFFEELDIPKPHFHLGVGGGSHGQNTGRMLEKIEAVLMTEKPSMVLVYGDTDSTLAGALAAVKLHIPVSHVEAGLRSFNKKMPEEINRILTDHAADLLFTPTATATRHAASEGIAAGKTRQVGDVMYDAALFYLQKAGGQSSVLKSNNLVSKQFVLVTLHRAENVDSKSRLQEILLGLSKSNLPVIWPMHPRAKKRLQEFGLVPSGNIHIIEPVGYLDMILLEKHAALIATDSGGVQKEAYFHKVPCVTMRDETEWIELVECGANTLTGADAGEIEKCMQNALQTAPRVFDTPLYGNGDAGELIIRELIRFFD